MPAEPRPGRARRAGRTATTLVLWCALGLGGSLLAFATLPPALGLRTLNVLSGSMEPTLQTGSVVIDEVVPARDLRIGDLATFPDPENHGRLITHRVRSLRLERGKAYVTTRGDANRQSESWEVPAGDELGRVAYHLPKLGYARTWAAGKLGRLAVVGLVLLWGLMALRDIWRPKPAAAETSPA